MSLWTGMGAAAVSDPCPYHPLRDCQSLAISSHRSYHHCGIVAHFDAVRCGTSQLRIRRITQQSPSAAPEHPEPTRRATYSAAPAPHRISPATAAPPDAHWHDPTTD